MPRRVPLLLAVGVVWVALMGAKGGCDLPRDREDGACTEIGCVDSATIRFEPPLTDPGFYSIELEADGRRIDCSVTVPGFVPVDACGDFLVRIDQPYVTTEQVIDGNRFVVQRNTDGIAGVTFYQQAPRSVKIDVRRDGFAVLQTTVAPVYETSTPNGPGCPPTCSAGTATLASE